MHSLILHNLKHDSKADLLNARSVTQDTIKGLALGVLCFAVLKGYSFLWFNATGTANSCVCGEFHGST